MSMIVDCKNIADFLDATDQTVIIVLNHNTAADTVECVAALQEYSTTKILLLDNGSDPEDVADLRAYTAGKPGIILICNSTNLGFAAAHNRAFDALLDSTAVRYVILLNSDIIVGNDVVACLRNTAKQAQVDMVGGRMMLYGRETVDSLGICYYKSGLASNRKTLSEPLLGPTGGCALYTRTLLMTVRSAHGELFDESFFCYAEDTDLALRARLLGFSAAFAHDTEIRHKLARSSGGRHSHFVLYHGIRNSLLTLAKSWPTSILLKHSLWISLMLLSVLLLHWRWRELKVVLRAYKDFCRLLPRILAKRGAIQSTSKITARHCRQFISSRFYDPGIIRESLVGLLSRRS